jgi:hypothetical protein
MYIDIRANQTYKIVRNDLENRSTLNLITLNSFVYIATLQ